METPLRLAEPTYHPLSTIMSKRNAKEGAKAEKAKARLSYRDGQIYFLNLPL